MTNPLRQAFPALHNRSIAYLDSASTTQVPSPVIDAISEYLTLGHGNAQRGMYAFSQDASVRYQQCRELVRQFIQAPVASDIIFTKSATESINLVAHSLRSTLTSQHSICVTAMEHHANLLPWQRLCKQTGARLHILAVDAQGALVTDALSEYLTDQCALLAVTHVSNVTGIGNDVKRLCQLSRTHQVPILIDGAQAVAHQPVNVAELGCDYYVFSGHKMYGPTGIGVLYTRTRAAQTLEPLLLGGGIVNKVTAQQYQVKSGPEQFEAGSANMIGIIGLAAAITWIQHIGWLTLTHHQRQLSRELATTLSTNPEIRLLTLPQDPNVFSFVHRHIHSHDLASILAQSGVAVRAGHHCAQPYLAAMGIKHCIRVSLACYNTRADLDLLFAGLDQATKTFATQ